MISCVTPKYCAFPCRYVFLESVHYFPKIVYLMILPQERQLSTVRFLLPMLAILCLCNLRYFLNPHTFPEILLNICILLPLPYSVSSFYISPSPWISFPPEQKLRYICWPYTHNYITPFIYWSISFCRL